MFKKIKENLNERNETMDICIGNFKTRVNFNDNIADKTIFYVLKVCLKNCISNVIWLNYISRINGSRASWFSTLVSVSILTQRVSWRVSSLRTLAVKSAASIAQSLNHVSRGKKTARMSWLHGYLGASNTSLSNIANTEEFMHPILFTKVFIILNNERTILYLCVKLSIEL